MREEDLPVQEFILLGREKSLVRSPERASVVGCFPAAGGQLVQPVRVVREVWGIREICLGVLAVTEAADDVVRPVLISDNAAVQLIGGLVRVSTIAFSYQAQKSIRLP
ncbi:hypothetical protein [Streptomyces lavendulae]